ncbi:MAG: YicC/YloC family endoribonuclease [Spirochaetota bacterium]
MTGYASRSFEREEYVLFWEIKSLNYRYLEVRVRVPPALEQFEILVRRLAGELVSRGKVEVTLKLAATEQAELGLLRGQILKYHRFLNDIARETGISLQQSVSELLALRTLLGGRDQEPPVGLTGEELRDMFREVAGQYERSRLEEGAMTRREIERHLASLSRSVDQVEAALPAVVERYRLSLEERIRELAGEQVDETRIITEAGIYANKVDVSEEVARIRGHLDRMKAVLSSREPCGRELDFITQELLREINTVGSKVPDYTVAQKAVEMKTGLDKIKEQVRNVE